MIPEDIARLRDRDAAQGYAALRRLLERSRAGGEVYPWLEALRPLLGDKSAYVRTRAFLLIAANARWDGENRVDAMLEPLLERLRDPKPTVARQCIQALPELARAKPRLAGRIRAALLAVDPGAYADSLRPLIAADIRSALREIPAPDPPSQIKAACCAGRFNR